MAIQNEKNKKQTNAGNQGSSTGAGKQKETATGKENSAARSAADAYIIETDENGKDRIRLTPPGNDPTLDPESKEFDPEKWEKYAADANKYLHASTEKLMETIKQAMAGTIAAQQIANESNSAAFMSIQNYLNSTQSWKATRASIIAAAEKLFPVLEFLQFGDSILELQPFLEAELQKPKYNGKSINELYKDAEKDDNGNLLKESLFMQALNAAAEARERAEERQQLPQVTYKNSAEVKIITDKFANLFFSPSAPQSKGMINGQRQFTPVRYEQPGAKKGITFLYDYSFDKATIDKFGLSKSFDDQDFFVAALLDNLLDEGNQIISETKLWHELGNTGSPNPDALTKLMNILHLGMSTTITANISEIYEAWGITTTDSSTDTAKELTSPVMPVQIVEEKFIANGNISNAIIKITGHTPFYIIGHALNHYSTWDKDILRLYTGRRTKRYYSVMRFLTTQIGWMRNAKSKRGNKILYDSLYNYVGDKTTRARQLSRDMMYRLLDEVFIPTGYISAYKEDTRSKKPGVKLTVTNPPQIATKKK